MLDQNLQQMVQNLPYFIYTKTQSYIQGKNKVAKNEKWKNQLWAFVYIKYGKF